MIRLRITERMGWTFTEYDEQSMLDIMTALEIWRIDDLHKTQPTKA